MTIEREIYKMIDMRKREIENDGPFYELQAAIEELEMTISLFPLSASLFIVAGNDPIEMLKFIKGEVAYLFARDQDEFREDFGHEGTKYEIEIFIKEKKDE